MCVYFHVYPYTSLSYSDVFTVLFSFFRFFFSFPLPLPPPVFSFFSFGVLFDVWTSITHSPCNSSQSYSTVHVYIDLFFLLFHLCTSVFHDFFVANNVYYYFLLLFLSSLPFLPFFFFLPHFTKLGRDRHVVLRTAAHQRMFQLCTCPTLS